MTEPVSKIDSLVRAIDTSIHQTSVLFAMLLDELYGTEDESPEDDLPRALVASEDPSICQHPNQLQVLDQALCNDCGSNL